MATDNKDLKKGKTLKEVVADYELCKCMIADIICYIFIVIWLVYIAIGIATEQYWPMFIAIFVSIQLIPLSSVWYSNVTEKVINAKFGNPKEEDEEQI